MTATAFEHSGQLVQPIPAVQPTSRPAAAAAVAAAPTRSSVGADALFRGSVALLVFAVVVLLAAFLFTSTPAARWDVDLTVPFLAACAVAIIAIVAWTWRR